MIHRYLWMLLGLALPLSAPAYAQQVDVTTMAGEQLKGQAVSLTTEGVTLTSAGQEPVIRLLADIARVVWTSDAPQEEPNEAIQIRLVDGSLLLAQQCTVAEGEATLQLVNGQTAEVSTRNIDWIRFQSMASDSPLLDDWNEIVDSSPTGDLLIVRREVDGQAALSALDGVLGNLSPTTLSFKFDDSQVDVERDRIDTLVYYHPSGRRLPGVQAQAVDRFGQTLQIRSWEVVEGRLLAKTNCNAEVPFPLDDLRLLDFEVGRVLSLVEIEPATFEWTPFISGPEGSGNLQTLFAISKNQSFSGRPLSLYSESGFGSNTSSTRQFARGLALRSQTRLIYRLPEDYQRLVGWIGIDPEVRPRGHVKIIMEGDGRLLQEAIITGDDPEPLQLDLEIKGVSRLSFQVQFGEGGDLGDRVHFCELRAIK